MSCALPEDLLVTILSERLQVRGMGASEMVLLQSTKQRGGIWGGGDPRLRLEESWAACRGPGVKLQMP